MQSYNLETIQSMKGARDQIAELPARLKKGADNAVEMANETGSSKLVATMVALQESSVEYGKVLSETAEIFSERITKFEKLQEAANM